MRILYIYPHPDDESFGPAAVMSYHRRSGHEVFLLTLTRGEATKQRFKYGFSKEEMGEVRYGEMQEMAKILDLTDLTVLDFPDGRLKELDPRLIEEVVRQHIEQVEPKIIVSYPVHGVSGFHDHLVTHAVVKRVYCDMRANDGFSPGRLVFMALREAEEGNPFNLQISTDEEIDCMMEVDEVDAENNREALRCYKTYMAVIAKSRRIEHVSTTHYFEIFQEFHDPWLSDFTEHL